MSQGIGDITKSALLRDLGVMEYGRALGLQIQTRNKKIHDPGLPDCIFFVQHLPVFTLGKRGGMENLMVSETFLTQKGITVFETDRGGNITYHGPGQAVLYPVVDLERARIGVADFVFGLEEIMKQTVADFGIPAQRNERNNGLWITDSNRDAKIGSVGLSIKKGIAIHGMALNVCPDLTPFSWINPCGLHKVAMTSMAAELRRQGVLNPQIAMSEIKDKFAAYFCKQFNIRITQEPFDGE